MAVTGHIGVRRQAEVPIPVGQQCRVHLAAVEAADIAASLRVEVLILAGPCRARPVAADTMALLQAAGRTEATTEEDRMEALPEAAIPRLGITVTK